MKKFCIISLIVLAISSFVSMDLLFNLLGSLIPSMNDGISVHSFIWGNLYFRDRAWSHERFYDAFVISSFISFMVFLENIVLIAIVIIKKKQ